MKTPLALLALLVVAVLAGCSSSDPVVSTGELPDLSSVASPEPSVALAEPSAVLPDQPDVPDQPDQPDPRSTPPAALAYSFGDDPSTPETAPLGSALEQRSLGPPVMRVLEPLPDAQVTSPVFISVEVDRFRLEAKGLSRDGEGHLHVLIDAPCVAAGDVIADEHHHVGDGSSNFSLDLAPGDHTLCFQIGDGFHSALSITETRHITVVEG